MNKSKKEYIIVGSDNFWYSSGLKSVKGVKDEIEFIKDNIEFYGREELPECLYVYEANEIKSLCCDLKEE